LENINKNYPFIELCGDSIQQMKNGISSSTILRQVNESFSALNRFCERWIGQEFNDYTHENLRKSGLNHMVSGESQSVLQNPILRKEREFFCQMVENYSLKIILNLQMDSGFTFMQIQV